MSRLLDGFCRLLKMLMAATLAVMVALVFGNVALRYGFNSGISVSEELSRWLFLWMTFLGAVVALHERSHLGTDMVVAKLPPLPRRLCFIAAHVLMLYVTWLLLRGSWQQAVINLDVRAPVTGASVAIFYATGIFFAAFGGLILLLDLLRAASGRMSDAELTMVHASEETDQLEELHLDKSLQSAVKS